jgi:hypothetical protein
VEVAALALNVGFEGPVASAVVAGVVGVGARVAAEVPLGQFSDACFTARPEASVHIVGALTAKAEKLVPKRAIARRGANFMCSAP